MKDITIRKLEISDLTQIETLLATRDDLTAEECKARIHLMKWLAFSNPQAEGNEATYFVAEYNGRVVGFHGRMPTIFIIGGNYEKGYYTHDLFVDPEFRKKGLGFWISMELAETIECQSNSILVLYGMTKLNLQIQRRRGYFESKVYGYIKLLDPGKQLSSHIKNKFLLKLTHFIAQLALNLFDTLWLPLISSKVEITKVERFDTRFDDFLENLVEKIGNCTRKSAAYLNWKYIDRPYKREEILTIQENDRLLGYAIVGFSPHSKDFSKGVILDIMVDPDDHTTLANLVRASIDYFKEKKAVTVNCVISDPRYVEVFRRFLFLKKSEKGIMLGHLEKLKSNSDSIKDMDSWHFTTSESDAYMLNPNFKSL